MASSWYRPPTEEYLPPLFVLSELHAPHPVSCMHKILLFPPNLSFGQPYTTDWNCSRERAPAHIMQGSQVTYRMHELKSAASKSPLYLPRRASTAIISAWRVPCNMFLDNYMSIRTPVVMETFSILMRLTECCRMNTWCSSKKNVHSSSYSFGYDL